MFWLLGVAWTVTVFAAGAMAHWTVIQIRLDREGAAEDGSSRPALAPLPPRASARHAAGAPGGSGGSDFSTEAREEAAAARARAVAKDPALAAAYAAKAGSSGSSTREFPVERESRLAAARAREATARPGPCVTGQFRTAPFAGAAGLTLPPRPAARFALSDRTLRLLEEAARPARSVALVTGHRSPGGAQHRGGPQECPSCANEGKPQERTQAPAGPAAAQEPGKAPGGAEGRGGHLAGTQLHHGSRWACGSNLCRVTEAQYQEALADPEQDFMELLGCARPA